jgi:hypothetical protein
LLARVVRIAATAELIDGEAVVLRNRGRCDFGAQERR